ncbi:uncharacterized protein JN550_004403 [Neoarthrinium moseri]|uniref:uncharacterized protein n=1 Tax=Neoarthrinium moseri TaxID=1658444 RepID=UPI001FDB3BB4|nr:uncharacterized protein JN550_004403 [Neoarthrinium moseri]KAI1871409.1 hypothetical protein JN550_004403 [Neoarthrinium moseri]
MSPKRKSGAQAEQAVEQQRKRKSSDNENGSTKEGSDKPSDSEVDNREPHDYYCINRHFFDIENENNAKDEDDQLDEDEIDDHYDEYLKKNGAALKPASDFPDQNKWIAMWETWTVICDYRRRATYTCPDFFGMYVYNDFNGYGLQELIENLLASLDEELKKKSHDDKSLKHMWAMSAALIHWLLVEQLNPWMGLDDGERVQETVRLIGLSFLATLNEIDKASLLKKDSTIKDLGLVMSLYLQWSNGLGDYGIDGEENIGWRKDVVAYAKKARVDLEANGCFGIGKVVKLLDEEHDGIEPLPGAAKADRWGWKKTLTAYTKSYGKRGKIGGEQFNIMKMSRKERASHAFDKKDPLAQFSEKDLREGNVALA